MKLGYQGEPGSYSHRATAELFPDDSRGFETFVAAFEALESDTVDRLVLPIENSTTGSVLPVLDRLVPGGVTIVGEHHIEVQHSIMGVPGSTLEGVLRVRSHPEALAQAERYLTEQGWKQALREDPHLQLQGEPGHRPPHRHDDPSARSRPRRRSRRFCRRIAYAQPGGTNGRGVRSLTTHWIRRLASEEWSPYPFPGMR